MYDCWSAKGYFLLIYVVLGKTSDVVRLSNNYRELQDARAEARTIYKTTSSGGCDDITYGPTATRSSDFPHLSTTSTHWIYMDQHNWYEYDAPNECDLELTPVEAYPGESPIDIDADNLTLTNESTIQLTGFDVLREHLTIENDGHGIQILVCADSYHDCNATAKFGTWPKLLRGITDDNTSDTYYLKYIKVHWGSDNSKGSEHAVCGSSAAGELQMVFWNMEDVADNRDDPSSGTKYAIISTMIEGGADDDNEAYSDIFSHIPITEDYTLEVDVQLDSLLAADYDSKYFTYAGSLTTPPCLQQVTWYVSQNSVHISNGQLDLIRQATMLNHEHDNSYEAIMFPFVAIVLGTATEHLIDRYAPFIPYTVAVLVEGLVVDQLAVYNRKKTKVSITSSETHIEETVYLYVWPEHDSTMQKSIDMWADIDGHLLLYAFLPALLFGEAMTLNVHMFMQTFFQTLLLACPGVLIGTFATGFAAMKILPYDWNFNFAMVFGSILAATDPVAVVALLKSVGASSKLTMQITGESLMNDGTAIVLFALFMKFYNEEHLDSLGIVWFFLQMTIAGPLIGIGLGLLAVLWIRSADRRYSHSDITVQTSITICCAYMAFFLAESESGSSGVLCTVACAIILSKFGWPLIISHETIENVWHAVEYVGNTLIFFLAGVITRRALTSEFIFLRDYLFCCIMYLIMMVIRFSMIAIFYPLLSRMGYGTTPKDAFFMGYGGLRGAVGLALAISVKANIDDEEAADQLLFLVAGLAFLTLIINGTTSGLLLNKLRMVGMPELKKQMVQEVRKRVIQRAEKDYNDACAYMNYEARDALELISSLKHLVDENESGPESGTPLSQCKHCGRGISICHKPKKFKKEQIEEILRTMGKPERKMLELMRETFLRIVRAGYWKMIEEGNLPAAQSCTLELLKSVDISLDNTKSPLHDWDFLTKKAECDDDDVIYDDVLNFVDRVLPDSCTFDNEIFYRMNFQHQEASYHICHGFIESHRLAQEKIAVFHGDDKGVDTAEEATVILESLRMVNRAEKVQEIMSKALIKHIKTMFVADKIIHMQQRYVHKLIEQGILAEAEAEGLLHELEHDAHNIDKARKRRARAFSKDAVHGNFRGDIDLTHVSSRASRALLFTEDISKPQSTESGKDPNKRPCRSYRF